MPTAKTPSPTEVRFHADLDQLAEELVKAFGLRFKKAQQGLNSPLLRWLDFRLRYVEPYPRPVMMSDCFPKAGLPPDAQAGLQALVRRFEQGEDVNPYQGRGLIMRNDTSAESDKRHTRTDLLFADWGILHFHLSDQPIPQGRYFSKSADYIAFCLVGGNAVAFLDVLPHPDDREEFANPHLFDVMARNWPEHVEEYRLRGVVAAPDSTHTQEDQSALREGGLTTMYTHQGAVYFPPGGGVTSASTAGNVTSAMVRIQALVDTLANMADLPGGQMQVAAQAQGIQAPVFGLGIGPSGLSVVEVSTMDTASPLHFLLAAPQPGSQSTPWRELNDAFAPPWAAKALCP